MCAVANEIQDTQHVQALKDLGVLDYSYAVTNSLS